jgi:hypothetical protein
MKKIDIFIRTYHKDLDFLKYCLRSIRKFVTGYNEIIICIPEQDAHLLDSWNLTQELIIKWDVVCENGYIDQQISKLKAHEMSDADYILYVDSDVCFFTPTDLSEFFIDGKPYLMKTRYELVGDAICWKECTEEILNIKLDYEYMRRIPIMFRRSTLGMLSMGINIDELAKRKRLSEFNVIGAYAALIETDKYHIINTEFDPLPKQVAKQYWSWGTLTEEIKQEMEEILK